MLKLFRFSISSCILLLLSIVSLKCLCSATILDSLISDTILYGNPLGRTDDTTVIERWNKLRNDLEVDLDLFTSGIASRKDDILRSVSLENRCEQKLIQLFDDAKKKRTEAIRALNSWGHIPPSGMLSGTAASLGAFDQCLSAKPFNSSLPMNYCSILFRPLLPQRPRFHQIVDKLEILDRSEKSKEHFIDELAGNAHFYYYIPLRVGVCLPSECGLKDVHQLAINVGQRMLLQGEAVRCESKETFQVELTIHRKIALMILSTIVLLTIIGTVAECLQDKPSENLAARLLCAFSIRRNLVSLFAESSSNNELKSLNGIRCLSMSWIILGHTTLWTNHHAFSNTFRVVDIITPLSSQALLNVTLSVETFFLISGLLTSYVTWKTYERSGLKFNAFWFIISRYIRLTPALVCSICLVFFLPYFGSGPIWTETIQPIVNGCEENWWVNLLYMQAFLNPEKICLLPTWWLSNDMIFHIISLFVLLPLMKSQKWGKIVIALVITTFAISTAIISSLNDYPPGVFPTAVQVEEYWLDYVIKFFWRPYLHGPPFFIGLYLGYLLARKRFIRLDRIHIVFWWTIALSTLYFVLHAPYPLTLGETWSKPITVIFDSTNRILWSLAVGWIIYASAAGYGGLFYDFLSHKIFAPFAKITFCVYLTHMLFIWVYMGSRRELTHTSVYNGIYMFLPHWLLAQVFGIICAALFEAPFLNIQKLLANRTQAQCNENIALKDLKESDEQNAKSPQDVAPI
ncbi:nose resistant to fluoxetine protein 6-like [Brevipalpus obovatus]|uniref:nose resistant to fluoxetine protein 6-like n=1 Tax=Brevipalpus obovatus TaxID=246614 RepID=UPI003D9FA2E1